MTTKEPGMLRLSKETPVAVTLGTGIAVIFALATMGGLALKAKQDIERANDKQDAAISRLEERDRETRDVLKEIGADVKKLLEKVK